ncbi:MAG: hypothetical protein HQM14_00915 [SAR324 cluster bacterium]|nr:hypothetical protein [SAR324 cluster bacterium]
MPKQENTITIAEVEEVEGALSIADSVAKILTPEEITTYSDLTEEFLSSGGDVSFDTRLMALAFLKTLSHLSGNKDKLYTQIKKYPFDKHAALYYAVPFLSEIQCKGNSLQWHQNEIKRIFQLKHAKGDYEPLRLMILLYESVLFQSVTDKKKKKKFLALADKIFKKIREQIQDLQNAYQKKDAAHPWLSLDKSSIATFRDLVAFWKTTVDSVTVRHGSHLPPQFRRPPDKLPFEWSELLRIKKVAKISMINAIYPLHGLSSQCREIRTYSSFLMHQVCQERPNFLESFKNAQVQRHFLNRLQVAYRVQQAYPKLPEGMPDKFQTELFLVLIEQAINTLAKKHALGDKSEADLQSSFSDFNEQVQTKDEIVIEISDENPDSETSLIGEFQGAAISGTEEVITPKTSIVETDFPPITDDQELGMGMATMPYIFPFTYEEGQEELPLEHIPNIRWNELKWSGMAAPGVSLQVAETKLFVNKLEIVNSYRYDIYSIGELKKIKSYRQYNCFIGKHNTKDGAKHYIVRKGGKKTESGKSVIYIAVELSEQYMQNINKAFFFIFPEPYMQHILAIPR